jgi:hypothetical protein
MELYQIYVAVNLALFLVTWFFQGNEYGGVKSEEEIIRDDHRSMNAALGTMWQLEDYPIV